jgi:hypothetical protein
VVRQNRSRVTIRKNDDPVKRYLDDAWALARTSSLDEAVRRPVVAGFWRPAWRRRSTNGSGAERLTRGERHADVERLIDPLAHRHLRARDARRHPARGDVMSTLNRDHGGWVDDTKGLANAVRRPVEQVAA